MSIWIQATRLQTLTVSIPLVVLVGLSTGTMDKKTAPPVDDREPVSSLYPHCFPQ